MELLDVGASTRATTFQMTWTIHPHEDRMQALLALADLMPDIFTFTTLNLIDILEPLPTDSLDYTFGADHTIYLSRTRHPSRVTAAEILAPSNLTGQAFDFAEMNHDKPLQDRRRDPHATTAAHVADHAAARLRKAILAQDLGSITVPPHVGLELNDVIAYDDLLVDAAQIKARVRAITTTFDRRPGRRPIFEQKIHLGGL
ncbi:hypothetical protein LCGC14_1878980 [marine sediment metagenome]|uniref:Uncharacterized protein n=1 Tax=marine sediment metagenome TaxID=412755 RepID=A0A0F9J1C6_9ZZZZ